MPRFILITGRTAKQGEALHKGKDSDEYRQATGFVEMSSPDREHLGVEEGQRVRVSTAFGEAELKLREGNLPEGMIFVPMGPAANALIGSETRGTGMPDSKGLEAEVGPVMRIENVVCPFCGCLCDDIVVEVEDNRVTAVKKVCSSGRSLFLNAHTGAARPTVDGKEVAWPEAIDTAARLLADSASPLIYGLSSTASEAQRKAIALADLLGASIDSTSSVCHGPTTIGIQNQGEPTCTLGEIKHRADLVIFWGCNPAEAHQRHFARYSVSARGKLTPQGRQDRTVVVVDVRPTRSSRNADIFLQPRPGCDFDVLTALRALLKGETLDVTDVGGVSVAQLTDLVERMKTCRFGVIFFGMGVTQTGGKYLNITELLALVADMNDHTRFTAMPMRGHGNVAGADSTLTWQTGYPFAINFARGYPQYNPGEFTAVDLLARQEADAALIIASDPVAHFPRQAADRLSQIPTIVLDPEMNLTAREAKVFLPTAIYGVSAAGTAYRMDNVPLPLKKVVDSPQPTDEQVLDWMIERVKT